MAALPRVLQKIFGATGGTTEFGEFGSDSLGSAQTTKDLALIQSLSPYSEGLFAATDSANEPPRIQDINALYLLFSSQLKYLFQCGIPEWIATEDYYANVSFCQVAGVIYQCIVDIAGASGNTSPATDTTHWQSMGFLPGKQLAFNATYLGLPFDPTDQYADIKQKIALSHKAGEILDSAINEAAVAYSAAQSTAHPSYPEYNPIVPFWDSDHDLALANYPILVPKLRAQKSEAWSGSAYVTDFSVTVSGSTITGSGTAWDAMLAALAEDVVIQGSYTNWRCINIAGTDYAITNVAAASHTVTVSGSPTTGSQTAIFYHRRIAGSTAARTFKDSGRALMSPDGTLRIAGLRRRFHMQGHVHGIGPASSATNTGGGVGNATALTSIVSTGPLTDGTNGTPITGPETEPNSSTVYRAMWAQTLL
jgi:hypothetical protein